MKRSFGFTLIELLIVLILVSLLAGLASPVVTTAVVRAKESALSENLQIIRIALDEYYADKGYYPASESDLVDERYLRFIPVDPITKRYDWNWIQDDQFETNGIVDLKSNSDQESTLGNRYSDW